MIVSIQGIKGSYHHMASQNYFGKDIILLERDYFPQVFDDVESGRAGRGIIAIENSIAGSLHENYDLLLKHKLFIVGEIYLRISHQLMTLPGTELSEVKQVLSHPMAIKQCRDFLDKHPDWEIIEESDTAGSAAKIRRERREFSAAIAGKIAAEIFDMDIVAESIETNPENYTRFLIISKHEDYEQECDKTSVVFTTEDHPGSLAKILAIFAETNINLTKIESRPIIGQSWKYYFYIDFEAGIQEPKVQKALAAAQVHAGWIKVLGSYKHGEHIE